MSIDNEYFRIYNNKICDWNKCDDCVIYSQNQNISIYDCVSACFNDNSFNKMCTGCTVSPSGNTIRPFCILWYNDECYEPTTTYNYGVTTYSFVSRSASRRTMYALLMIIGVPFTCFVLFFCIMYCVAGYYPISICKKRNKIIPIQHE